LLQRNKSRTTIQHDTPLVKSSLFCQKTERFFAKGPGLYMMQTI
jgi:hypothetical protein